MAEHEHGEMDITEHEKTFEGFIRVLGVCLRRKHRDRSIFLAIFNS